MNTMLVVLVALAVVLAVVVHQRVHSHFENKRAAEAREHREAGRAKLEQDQRAAAELRDRLSGVAVEPHQWPSQFNSVYARLTANLPDLPEPSLYPGQDPIPFHRAMTEDDLSLPFEYTMDEGQSEKITA